MRRIWTNLVRAVYVFTVVFWTSACNSDLLNTFQQPQEVGFYVSTVQTRTEMLSNGLSATWENTDEVALWAKNSSDFVLSNQIFKMHGFGDGHGYFTSKLASAMPEGSYTYYACYPKPIAVDGTKVTFTLPAEQDGKVSSGADIMISEPVVHGPLAPLPEVEDGSSLSLKMNHMMHQFRFYIPEGTGLGSDHIKRFQLIFPKPVVGNVTIDVADPSAAPVLTDGSNIVTVNLEEVLVQTDEEGRQYACVAIFPTKFDAGQSVQIKAYTSTMIAKVNPVDLKGRSFQAGHSTPVKLLVESINDYPYRIAFNVSANNLGEDVNSITFTAPSGCIWGEYGKNEYTYTPGHKITKGEQLVFRFENESDYKAFSGKNVTFTFDSDHAVTSASVAVGNISTNAQTDISAAIPYVFYEDFSSLVAYDGDYTGGPYVSESGASVDARDLSQYGISSGWSGARTGCDAAGTAILVAGRVDCVIAGATRAYGRLDSPCLTSLKNGANIKVFFDYSGSRSGDSTYYPVGVCGYTNNSGLINGYASQFQNEALWNDIDGYISIPDIPTSGSASAVNKKMEYTVKNCDSTTRLSWHVAGMGYKSWKINNGIQWMYIDNIKVQIVNQ